METTRIQNGQTERIIASFYDKSYPPVPLTGETVSMSIWRESNNEWFTGSGWQVAYTTFNMSEFAQGHYYYDFDTSGLADDTYHITAICSNADCGSPVQIGELKVGYFIDKIDTIETLCTYIKKLGNNRMLIDENNNQMIIYDDDKVTPLVTFNLKDSAGVAAHQDVYERDPA